jgi:uncharacterized protein YdaU (DUF1376 family)
VPNKSPAFQWYPKDFESDEVVKLMNLEEIGAYFVLLNHEWLNGSIPADEFLLARLLRVDQETFSRLWPMVSRKFKPRRGNGGRLVNPKMERIRKSQSDRRKRLKKAAEKRWEDKNTVTEKPIIDKVSDASASPEHMPGISSSSSPASASPSASTKNKKESVNYQQVVDAWNAHSPTLQKCIKLNPRIREHLRARLKDYEPKQLYIAFFRYKQVLDDKSGMYWLTYRWSLLEFLRHNAGDTLGKFLSDDWQRNFKDFKRKQPERNPEHSVGSQEAWT